MMDFSWENFEREYESKNVEQFKFLFAANF